MEGVPLLAPWGSVANSATLMLHKAHITKKGGAGPSGRKRERPVDLFRSKKEQGMRRKKKKECCPSGPLFRVVIGFPSYRFAVPPAVVSRSKSGSTVSSMDSKPDNRRRGRRACAPGAPSTNPSSSASASLSSSLSGRVVCASA